jgi:hypothetical protein
MEFWLLDLYALADRHFHAWHDDGGFVMAQFNFPRVENPDANGSFQDYHSGFIHILRLLLRIPANYF